MRTSGLALSPSARATVDSAFLSLTVMISLELRAILISVGLAESTTPVSRSSPLSGYFSITASMMSSSFCGFCSMPAGRSMSSSGPG